MRLQSSSKWRIRSIGEGVQLILLKIPVRQVGAECLRRRRSCQLRASARRAGVRTPITRPAASSDQRLLKRAVRRIGSKKRRARIPSQTSGMGTPPLISSRQAQAAFT